MDRRVLILHHREAEVIENPIESWLRVNELNQMIIRLSFWCTPPLMAERVVYQQDCYRYTTIFFYNDTSKLFGNNKGEIEYFTGEIGYLILEIKKWAGIPVLAT